MYWKNSIGKLYLDFCPNNVIRYYYDVSNFASDEEAIPMPSQGLSIFRLKMTMKYLFAND